MKSISRLVIGSHPWWVLSMGVLFGVFITFLIKSQLHYNNNSVNINNNSNNNRLQQLHGEKALLRSKLHIIDQQIQDLEALQRLSVASVLPATSTTTSSSSVSSTTQQQSDLLTHHSNIEATNGPNGKQIMSSSQCEYRFKVYVYPIPQSVLALSISEEARRNGTLHVCQKCILEQFALEYIMYDFFTQFCGRTYDPKEADYFYLPLVRDAEFRFAIQNKGIRNRAPSASELALLNIFDKNDTTLWKSLFNVSDEYWNRNDGADHIIVMPAPVTNLRHETSQRGFFHYMMHLHKPIFLGLEYSKSFTDEYPFCSRSKNIVVPYPTTDPDLFNGKLLSFKIQRSALVYYAGGMHGDCVEIRKAMKQLMMNSTRLHNVIPKIKSIQEEREHGFLAATFCPVPVGDSPSSKRMYDVLNFGCIPIILSDDLVWAFSDQTGGLLNHSQFSIHMPQSVVQFTVERTLAQYVGRKHEFGYLPSGLSLFDILEKSKQEDSEYENSIYVNPLIRILRRIPASDVKYLQEQGKNVAGSYRYYEMNSSLNRIPTSDHLFPNGGAMRMIGMELEERKHIGITNILNNCQAERNRAGHQYIARYTCDTDKKDTLLKR